MVMSSRVVAAGRAVASARRKLLPMLRPVAEMLAGGARGKSTAWMRPLLKGMS